MTDQEALELGLVLAELESQLKARETPASPEEAGELLRVIMTRRAAEQRKKQTAGLQPGKDPLAHLTPEEWRKGFEKAEAEAAEREKRLNPKGVPVIFPGYD